MTVEPRCVVKRAMRISLASLIVKSPIPHVGEVMDRVVQCSELVPPLIEALIEADQERVRDLAKEISQLEHGADDAKNLIRGKMPARLFLPVDRRDLLRLLSEIDRIADSAEDVGVLLTLREMVVPDDMKTLLRLFVSRVVDCVRYSATLVAQFDPLLNAGFRGRAADQAQTMIEELARREHEADKLQDQLAKTLFRLEPTIPPVALFMWTKVLNKIGDMANHAENVGDQFRLFLAR